jgi:F-type H+-transporting ATPase subunit delta
LAEILDERAGMVAATVTTARPVPNDIQRSLEQRLTTVTQKKVRLNFEQDPDLIGGLVTRIGSTVYDGSVRNQLQLFKERMAG